MSSSWIRTVARRVLNPALESILNVKSSYYFVEIQLDNGLVMAMV